MTSYAHLDGPSCDPRAPSPIEPVVVSGRVEHGEQRGRQLGVPTANLVLTDSAEPPDGVYAGLYVRPDRSCWPAAVSVGRRPSFHPAYASRLLEAHLIGFTGDLYGEDAEVCLVAHLRPQMAFRSGEDLAAQLQRDIHDAVQVLAEWSRP